MKNILAAIFAVLILLPYIPASAALQYEYYISPDGSDSNPGTLAAPLATIKKAKEKISVINAGMSADIYVYIRGGSYRISSPITFTAADSGKNGFNIIYKAYNSEKPEFDATEPVSGWTYWKNGIWKAYVGLGRSFRQLYVNGSKATRAREPDSGSFKTAGGFDKDTSSILLPPEAFAGVNLIQGRTEIALSAAWTHKRLRISSAAAEGNNIRAIIMQTEADAIKAGPQSASITAGCDFWMENAIEYLDSPGEWYYSPEDGYIYYCPKSGEDLSEAVCNIPVLENILKISGTPASPVSNLRFEGLLFRGTGWTRPSDYGLVDVQANLLLPVTRISDSQYRFGFKKDRLSGAVNLLYVKNLAFSSCTFRDLGGCGITLYEGGESVYIEGCIFTASAGEAAAIGNDFYRASDTRMYPKNITLKNNYIKDVSNEYYGSPAITALYVDGLTIEHNHIKSVPYSGISAGWGWSSGEATEYARNYTISGNLIEDAMTKLHDGGFIYTPNPVYGTNRIQNNYLKGNPKSMSRDGQSVGIYHDGCSSGWTDSSNVIEGFVLPLSFQNLGGQIATNINSDNNSIAPFEPVLDANLADRAIYITNQHVQSTLTWQGDAALTVSSAGLENAWRNIIPKDALEASIGPLYKAVDTNGRAAFAVTLKNNTQSAVDVSVALSGAQGTVLSWYTQTMQLAPCGSVELPVSAAFPLIEGMYIINMSVQGAGITIFGGVYGGVSFKDAIIVSVKGPGYVETGSWNDSGLVGYAGMARYGYSAGAQAVFTPALGTGGIYRVFVYKVAHPQSDDRTKVEIIHADGVETKTLNCTAGQSGWIDYGLYRFAAGQTGNVKMTKVGSSYIRTSAVAFVPVVPDNGALAVGGGMLTAPDGNMLLNLKSKTAASASIYVYNPGQSQATGMFLIAAFNRNHKLILLQKSAVTAYAGQWLYFKEDITLPDGIEDGEVKLMFFDSLSVLKPLSKSFTYK